MSRVRLSGLLALACLVLSCQCKPTPQATAWASNHGATPTPAPPAAPPPPLPLEEPVATLRVPDSGFPRAVDDVLAAKCRRCHTSPMRHTAPFPLLTWDDTRGLLRGRPRFELMATAVKSGFMPYNVQANPAVERLTDEEKKTIVDWVAAGAPKAACPAAPLASGSARHPAPKASAAAGSIHKPRSAL